MVILHIETTDAENSSKYTISADQGTSITEICFGISAMIKCFLRTNLIQSPQEIYDFIKKYTEDTSMDLPATDENVETANEAASDEN